MCIYVNKNKQKVWHIEGEFCVGGRCVTDSGPLRNTTWSQLPRVTATLQIEGFT